MSLAAGSEHPTDHSQMESERPGFNGGKPDGNNYVWEGALKDEDCFRVRELLEEKKDFKEKKELLNKGWNEHKSQKAEDSTSVRVQNLLERLEEVLNEGSIEDVEPSPKLKPHRVWKGRTALHVAARRGDAKLVRLIREILHHPEGGKCSTQCGTQCHLLEVIDRDYELDALAMAVVNGNQRIVTLLKQVSRECTLNPYNISPEADDGLVAGEECENKGGLSEDHAEQLEGITKKVLQENSPKADDGLAPSKDCENEGGLSEEDMKQLEDITGEVLLENSPVRSLRVLEELRSLRVLEELYRKDCDYNFLDFNLYLFHFTFSTWKPNAPDALIVKIRNGIFAKASKAGLLGCLLDLQDGQGRTPLHVAVDSDRVQEFLDLISTSGETGVVYNEFVNKKDGAGRTPLYRAAAKKLFGAVEALLKDNGVDLKAQVHFKLGPGLDLDKLSWANCFQSGCVYIPEKKLTWKTFNNESNSQGGPGPNINSLETVSSTALHVAIILKHQKIVDYIVKRMHQDLDRKGKSKGDGTDWCRRHFTWPVEAAWKGDTLTYVGPNVSTMKLAVLVGSIPILQKLLKEEEEKPGLFTDTLDETELPSFHLAAAIGNPAIIKAFLDSEGGTFNPKKLDTYKNTALHHALKGKSIKFHPHLVDFVGCNHVFHWRWENDVWVSDWLGDPTATTKLRRAVDKYDNGRLKDLHGKRLGSINLLLQAGIDIWAKNESERTANPEPDASDDFAKWWYEKVATEMQRVQQTLNAAANAISVTAALVATASYVGPLQPPLGYDGDSVQVNIVAVRVFVVCDSLSFYLALVAIMLALLPSLPLVKESMFREMVRTRILVAAAVTFLFPSIACVLLAFAAGSISVIPDHGLAHHGPTVATASVGGFFCLVVMIVSLYRLGRVYKESRIELGETISQPSELEAAEPERDQA